MVPRELVDAVIQERMIEAAEVRLRRASSLHRPAIGWRVRFTPRARQPEPRPEALCVDAQ